jgi:hypothetical protein
MIVAKQGTEDNLVSNLKRGTWSHHPTSLWLVTDETIARSVPVIQCSGNSTEPRLEIGFEPSVEIWMRHKTSTVLMVKLKPLPR